jgi:phenylacetic acid degradation protein paaN
MTLFQKYQPLIVDTIKSINQGFFFNHYPELPTDKIYAENSIEEGYQKFKSNINRKFEGLRQAMPNAWEGEEESPFLQQKLNVLYPTFDLMTLIDRARNEFHKWRKISPEDRAGLLLESLERIEKRFFEIAFATMHTTGMGYTMAFQVSGPHAAQRALNAIASGYEALKRYPESRFGQVVQDEFGIKLGKTWIPVPKGISLIIGCHYFPSRDTTPSIFASLITGNPVIVKPHSGSILPVAIVVSEIQKVFSEHGYDPNVCQLAVDSDDDEFIRSLIEHKDIKLIDYKGSCMMVDYLETIRDKTVFTEKFSVNSVIVDSTDNIDEVIKNIVISLSLFSGQMNNTPQNIFIPESGIMTREGPVSYESFVEKFIDQLAALINNEKGAQLLGAIMDPGTIQKTEKLERQNGRLLFKSVPFRHPEYKKARTLSPMIMELDPSQKELYQNEHFGPIGFFIKTKNSIHSLELAAETADKKGSLFCSVFTTNEKLREVVLDRITITNTPVTFNMVGNFYLDPNESFENYHMTGGNTASKASASNLDFVLQRFTWVGCKQPAYQNPEMSGRSVPKPGEGTLS